ncbi:MAG TPA: helix-turn-helix transcriptional regulator [Chloroflexota bacterium]|nr:helix-turn-helix transcriptional regulator [Chloroflexota bacterium]
MRDVRHENGVSQEGLAIASGLDCTVISAVERGVRNPSLLSVYSLADALGVPITRLLPCDDSVTPNG